MGSLVKCHLLPLSSNFWDLYLGYSWFDFQPEHPLSWHFFSDLLKSLQANANTVTVPSLDFFLAYYAWPRTPSTKVTRNERNPWRQHFHRATRPRSYAIDKVWEAVTSRCLGNGRSDASCKQYGGVSASYKQLSVSASYKQYVSDECTYKKIIKT